MRLSALLLVTSSFILLACNKFDASSVSPQSPKKVECVDDKGNLIFSSTVQKAAEMTTRKGFMFTDLQGKEFEIPGKCKLVD